MCATKWIITQKTVDKGRKLWNATLQPRMIKSQFLVRKNLMLEILEDELSASQVKLTNCFYELDEKLNECQMELVHSFHEYEDKLI